MSTASRAELGYVPALAIFEKPSVNTGVKSHKWIQFQPISTFANSGTLEFSIPGTSNTYINLKCSTLQIKGKIVDGDGKDIGDADEVALVNAPLHSIWSQVDLYLQKRVVNSKVGTNYAYKAYLDLLLNSSPKIHDFQYTSQLFFKDLAGRMDPSDNMQGGALVRKEATNKSKIIQLEAPLCLDLCEQDRYLLNGVPIDLKFWPNKSPFYVLSKDSTKEYQFHITDAIFNACTVEVSPGILVGHAAGIKISPALYPYFESYIKTRSISKGSFEFTYDNLFQGEIPAEVLVGLVSSEAYSGKNQKNPFNFQHYNCNYCAFYIDGSSVPREPLQPRFKSDSGETSSTEGKEKLVAYTDAYLSLFGHEYDNSDKFSIKITEYPEGYCLYRFPISQNIDVEDFISLPHREQSRLNMKFAQPLKEDVTVVIYARFPRVMQIDEARNVVL